MILGIFALIIVSFYVGGSRSWSTPEKLIVEIVAPFQKFIKHTIRITEGTWLKYFGLVQVRMENTRLVKEMNALRALNYRYRELLATHERLEGLLRFKRSIEWPVLAAQVIGRDPSGWFRSVIIDKGERHGLKINMPVVNADGVVGRLVSVSPTYAKVLLVLDQNSAVDCLIQDSRDKGILKGFTAKLCRLDYVLKTSRISAGDAVITSGMGRVFPKGVPVGTVTEVKDRPGELFKEIRVRPSVDFSKLEEVLIILKEDPLASQPKKKE
jgi:rod shape-determining protein MreC